MNSSAANLSTAVKGVPSGTESTLKGSFGSEVRVILNVTFDPGAAITKRDYLKPMVRHKCLTLFNTSNGNDIKMKANGSLILNCESGRVMDPY